MKPHKQRLALVEGAFFTSLTAIFTLINIYIPLFSFIAGLVGPMPSAVLIKKYDLKVTLLSLAAAVLIVVLFFGNPLAALLFTAQIGILGLFLGMLLKRNISAGISIVFSALVSVLLTFSGFLAAFFLTGINPFDIAGDVRQTVNEMYKFYQQSGVIENLDQNQLQDLQEQVVKNITLFLPGSLAIWSIITGGLNYLLTRELFKRLKFDVVNLKPFSHWHLPWYSTWAVILGIGLLLIGDSFKITFLSTAAKNILYIAAFVFAVLGLSVTVFYIKKLPFSKFIKIIILFMSFIYWPFTLLLLTVLGILDPYINFRKVNLNKE
ncbi:YybS family protein [Desulfolucanica intricata]|uniref:YybS family protein n=1 Tax=Desulfolucanica intricata TaxID=1285191 RepID=UPI000837191B|nr:YybS family protein [Desulfolucanica intricata]